MVQYPDHFFHTNRKVHWTVAALFKAVLCCVLHRFQQPESVWLWITFSQNASSPHMCYTHGQSKESAGNSLQKTYCQPNVPPGWGDGTWTPGRQKKTWGRGRSAVWFPSRPFTSWWVPLYPDCLLQCPKTQLLYFDYVHGNTKQQTLQMFPLAESQ